MPRQIFKHRIIATAEDLTADVTHLLRTREQFNSRVPRVKEALARGKHIHIIHYDWFEFSTVQENRQPEEEYSMRSVLAKQNAARRERERLERGQREEERGGVDPTLFHIYHDREFFPYRIVLTREDQASGEPGQKYTLCFAAKFVKKKAAGQASYYRPSACSGLWRVEMDRFMRFFRLKTGIAWEDRVSRQGTMAGSYFQYSPPEENLWGGDCGSVEGDALAGRGFLLWSE
ncbi:hypothetical protein ESCO_001375 [Escovopsis weberi]|uniref:BRCT domain-containing protein n=1 Tax=Escovopsis weberi TaxID=150374 RepID=A0A0M9VUA6_ESCWE|nr:hypothetical protein ESCO_001375 [Escovopsis weberi]